MQIGNSEGSEQVLRHDEIYDLLYHPFAVTVFFGDRCFGTKTIARYRTPFFLPFQLLCFLAPEPSLWANTEVQP
jgi:hypothetical protein